MRYLSTLKGLVLLATISCVHNSGASAQSATDTVPIGVINATELAGKLGFNISQSVFDEGNPVEWKAAADAGATWVRVEACDWKVFEQQTPAPSNTQASPAYVPPSSCFNALTYAKQYGLNVTMMANGFEPYHLALYVTPTAAVPVGATSATVSLASGMSNVTDLTYLRNGYDYFSAPQLGRQGGVSPLVNNSLNAVLTSRGDLPGNYISSFTVNGSTATLNFATPLTAALPAPITSIPNITWASTASGTLTITGPAGSFPQVGYKQMQLSIPNSDRNGTGTTTQTISSVSADGSTATLVAGVYGNPETPVTVTVTTVYAVEEAMYPLPATMGPNDAWVVAFVTYENNLGKYCTSMGVVCDLEGWNEPGGTDGHSNAYNANNYFLNGFQGPWGTGVNYGLGQTVSRSGTVYASVIANNYNVDPATDDGTHWTAAIPSTSYPGPILASAGPYNIAAAEDAHPLANGLHTIASGAWNGLKESLLYGDGAFSHTATSATWSLGTHMLTYTGQELQMPTQKRGEAAHPYQAFAMYPERAFGPQACFENQVTGAGSWGLCRYPGADQGPNIQYEYYLDAVQRYINPAYTLPPVVTETNTSAYTSGQDDKVAGFVSRQWTAAAFLKTPYVDMFLMNDTAKGPQGATNAGNGPACQTTPGNIIPVNTFGMICLNADGSLNETYPSYNALKTLVSGAKAIAYAPPVPYATVSSKLLNVTSYTGSTYPLLYGHVVGARSNIATADSEVFLLYQGSYPPTVNGYFPGDGTFHVTSLNNQQAGGYTTPLIAGDLLTTSGAILNIHLVALQSGSASGPGVWTVDNSTYTASSAGSPGVYYTNWMSHPAPSGATVVMSLDTGYRVSSAIDVVTQQPVAYTQSNGVVTLANNVGEHELALSVDPIIVATCPPYVVVCGVLSQRGR